MGKNDFNPESVGSARSGIFGLPSSENDARIVLIPAPWGVTVSYGGGTEDGPRAIFDASSQIDYYHDSYGADSWKVGITMLPLRDSEDVYKKGRALRKKAAAHIRALESGKAVRAPKEVNEGSEWLNERIEKTASKLLTAGKLVGLVGGDHSTPLGLMRALSKKHGAFGILQIDAHCDLREGYEGFTYSHASIMWNALKLPQISRLTQVGIRDYSIGEHATIQNSNGRIQTFFDASIKERRFRGESWEKIVSDIVKTLPEKVYISFDIDGLDPKLCPHTGTPVPGGLEFQEAVVLVRAVAESGKAIIGFDVNEVGPGKDSMWDANVGMRVLWNIALWAARSNSIQAS